MRREELYLADLIDNARAVRGYLDGVTRERWDAEDILRDAVLYRMLLLSEIAGALPDELRDRYPDVAWRQIRAFRNLAVHKYFGVDWAVVWKMTRSIREDARPPRPLRGENSQRKSGTTPVSCSGHPLDARTRIVWSRLPAPGWDPLPITARLSTCIVARLSRG